LSRKSTKNNQLKVKTPKAPKIIDHRGTLIIVNGKTLTIQQRLKKNSPYHSATEEQLMCYIAEQMNCPGFRLFSPEAAAMFNETDSHTGPGEKSVRKEEGFSLETQGIASLDIPELGKDGTEIKKGPIIKAGIHAQRSYSDFLFTTDMYVSDKGYWDDPIMWNGVETTYRTLFGMGVSNKLLEALKPEYADMIREAVCPAKILASYPNIALVIPQGYISVPREDYTKAWRFVSISQQIPRYRLRREYLEQKALSLVPQQVPDSTTIDADGQLLEESQTVAVLEVGPHLSATDVDTLTASRDGLKPDLPTRVEVSHVLLQVPAGEVSVQVNRI
jgi:hypothetical protein